MNLCFAGLAVAPIAVIGFRSLQVSRRYQRSRVGGLSMLPNYDHQEEIVLDMKFGSLSRGDVVVVDGGFDKSFRGFLGRLVETESFTGGFIKRVVGLPGERVRVQGHRIFINGKLLSEPYIRTTPPTQQELNLYEGQYGVQNAKAANSAKSLGRGAGRSVFILGPNEFFLAGDNRPLSVDSRHFGPIKAEYIVAKVAKDRQ